ncbi:Clavaminate synthase-like protein [Basidiobolus meristosporus CBS 931.73]|uniref:Clavaminate synthase-like protein n=1 Tax=Basidiobolus meristosporus CBS 931.73 TaxID=1314790 RepID=A0A1Y1YLI3_9FUNG|nr:Clavaminate synthase-like protein [Basidiobolus meristosporus CBS 931.73]|eukprot:ORX98862.1 Clavaminate synthase-like protein [Basidiobolus meristosporus CBS 931.73]
MKTLNKIDEYRYERKVRKIKVKARSELDYHEWNKYNYAKNDYWIPSSKDTLVRVDVNTTTLQEFIDNFEKPNLPAVLTGVTKKWAANKEWTKEALLKNYGSEKFKIGEDDEGDPVYMKMKYFLRYTENEGISDDSPLYIFDSKFNGPRKRAKRSKESNSDNGPTAKKAKVDEKCSKMNLLSDYSVPSYFEDDLFSLTGEGRRPPYRWIVIGGARSGTGIHTDPLGTSAWNALIFGHKRWILFPPDVPKSLVDPPMKPFDREAVSWFTHVYPKFQQQSEEMPGKTLGEQYGMIEVVQKPGETMFVPGGWHHVVMNLDFTVAITQNFCSPTNLESVWLNTRHSRPKLARKLLKQLEQLGTDGATCPVKNFTPHSSNYYRDLALHIHTLEFVPALCPSSGSSSSSSTSSSESDDIVVSDTLSETDGSDGECRCCKCKRKRKRALIRKYKVLEANGYA